MSTIQKILTYSAVVLAPIATVVISTHYNYIYLGNLQKAQMHKELASGQLLVLWKNVMNIHRSTKELLDDDILRVKMGDLLLLQDEYNIYAKLSSHETIFIVLDFINKQDYTFDKLNNLFIIFENKIKELIEININQYKSIYKIPDKIK